MLTNRESSRIDYYIANDAVLVRGVHYFGAKEDTEVLVSGEFDFTFKEPHEMVAEMEEKADLGRRAIRHRDLVAAEPTNSADVTERMRVA